MSRRPRCTRPPRWPGLYVALCALAAVLAAPLPAQEGQATLTVRVRMLETGEPLPAARVVVGNGVAAALTDAAGVARFVGLSAGIWPLVVQRLGYAPERLTVNLSETRPAELAVALRTQPLALAELTVQARRSRGREMLAARGFFARREAGFGRFITRDEIERQNPRLLSEVLWRVPGVQLSPTPFSQNHATMARNGGRRCPIQYFIDGIPAAGYNIDDMPATDVEGLEVYRGASEIPAEFNRRTAMCGVIVIWTRID
mgnify:CR=1 FL=1